MKVDTEESDSSTHSDHALQWWQW